MTAAVIILIALAVCLGLFLILVRTDVESAPTNRPAGSLAPRETDAAPQPPSEEPKPRPRREEDPATPKPPG